MILLNRLKYGLFLVFNKMIISLFVVSSFAIADNQVKILMLGDSLTQGYGLEEKVDWSQCFSAGYQVMKQRFF